MAIAVDPPKRRERGAWIYDHLPAHSHRLLDVGCHGAEDTRTWTDRADQVFGIDVDPAVFDGAPGVHLSQASAGLLPFRDASFDAVTCTEVLEHVPAEIEDDVISEIRRVITPGGTFLFTVPHHGWFDWLDPMDIKRRLGIRRDKGHKHYSVEEIERLFAGRFEIVELLRCSAVLHPLSTALGAGNQGRWMPLREAMSDWDYRHSFGRAAFNLALVARPI